MGLFSGSILPWFVASNDLSTINTRAIWLCFGAFLSPPAPCLRLHGALTTGHYSPATRHYLPAIRRYQRVQVMRKPPRWRLHDTNRRFATDRTGPDLDDRPPLFNMSPNRAIPTEKSIRCSFLAAVGPLTILSWPEALNASRSKRGCRMAIRRNACPLLALPDFPEFAQAVRYGVG